MRVLSLFDWIACWYEALQRAWIPIEKYCASEIDKYPIQIAMKNHPDIIQIGDVTKLTYHDWSLFWSDWPNDVRSIDWPFDLIIGGSPCQGFSMAGKMLNFNDPRSKLFFEFVRLVKEVKPKYFLLENVKMKKEYIEVINEQLWGITPTLIDSALVSAQRRKRLYWVWKLLPNGEYAKVEIPQPEDKGILLKDILLDYVEPKYDVSEKHTIAMKNARSSWELNLPNKEGKCGTIIAGYYKTPQDWPYILKDYELDEKQVNMIANWKWYEKPLERIRWPEDKMDTLTTHCGKMFNGIKLVSVPCATQIGQSKNWWNSYGSDKAYTLRACNPNGVIESVNPPKIRKLHPIECERLQTLPDNYTEWVSDSQRYKALGNWWTCDVIAHIFSFIK